MSAREWIGREAQYPTAPPEHPWQACDQAMVLFLLIIGVGAVIVGALLALGIVHPA